MKWIAKLQKKILDLDMSKKICIIFTIILLISMWLVYRITYNVYAWNIESTTENLMEQAAETMATSMDDTVQIAKLITIAPLFSPDLQHAFKAGSDTDPSELQESRFFFTFLNSMPLSNHAAGFYSQNGTLIFSRISSLRYSLLEDHYAQWKEAAAPFTGNAIVVAMDDESDYSCAILRSVIDTENFEDIGLAAVCISKSDFDQAFERIGSIDGGRAVVLDSANCVIYDSGEQIQNCSYEEDPVVEALSQETGRYSTEVNGVTYVGVTVTRSSGQYQILVFASRDELLADMRGTQRDVLLLFFCICLVVFVMILFISRALTVPLKKITSLMRRVQEGDFTVRFKSKTEDEIGVLGDNFNLLLDRLNQQIEDIVAINSKKKQMEIDILKSQINPHFIYNTLETIHMMAIEADQPEIEQMAKVFGRIMRYNITEINEVATIRQELSYLKDYLYIQNERFNHRFELKVHVDPQLMDCQIIKLLLQPVVENAMLHGLEEMKKKGTIQLYACRCKEGQLITISDDGVGIPADRLAEIQASLEQEGAADGNGIGLRNINSRIKLYYGKEYGVHIHSVFGQGTTVEMCIPVIGGGNEQDRIGG